MSKFHELDTRSFVSNAQVITSFIHSHVSANSTQIAINKSLYVSQPTFFLIEADKKNISIEEFLVLLDRRLMQEEAYKDEILQLRNDICEDFNQFCLDVSDQNQIKFIRNQRQKVIDQLFSSLKVEEMQITGKFYDHIMNGYDSDAMENFNDIVYLTLWKPFLAPFPFELNEVVKNAIKEIKNEKQEKKIEEIIMNIILFIKECLKNKYFCLSDFNNANELKNMLIELARTRKICSITIDEMNEEKIACIQEFRSKCIKNISIHIDSMSFQTGNFELDFSHLTLLTNVNGSEIIKVLEKLPKKLKSLDLYFANTTNAEMEIMKTKLENLRSLKKLYLYLNCPGNEITDCGVHSICQLLHQNKQILQLNLLFDWETNVITDAGLLQLSAGINTLLELTHLILNFNAKNIKITSNGMEALGKSLQNKNKIERLHLEFLGASINSDAIDTLANSLSQMSKMSYLNLGFGGNKYNSANDHSFCLLSQAIQKMVDLTCLNLYFWKSKHVITDTGIKFLSDALAYTPKITILQMQFSGDGNQNKITDKSIQCLFFSLKKMINLKCLLLDFSGGNNHEITDEGINSLSESLKSLFNIMELDLRFFEGKNRVSDNAIINLAAALKDFTKLFRLNLNFGGGDNSVSDIGIEHLCQSICNHKNLNELALKLFEGQNAISDKGMQFLAETIKKIPSLIKINFQFDGGNNSVSREGVVYLAEAVVVLSPFLDLECWLMGNFSTVTESDIDYLRNARKYLRFCGK